MKKEKFSHHTVNFLKQLKKLVAKANRDYRTIRREDYSNLKDLCSICKFERGLWYKERRKKAERNARAHEVVYIDLPKFIAEIKEESNVQPSAELKAELEKWNRNIGDRNLQANENPKYKEAMKYARGIIRIAGEWVNVTEQEIALLFYLESPLSDNAYRILCREPLKYKDLIIELDSLKKEQTLRIEKLTNLLEQKEKELLPSNNGWWKGDEETFKDFIKHLTREKLLEMNGKKALRPYKLNTQARGNISKFYSIVLEYERKGLIRSISEHRPNETCELTAQELIAMLNKFFSANLKPAMLSHTKGVIKKLRKK